MATAQQDRQEQQDLANRPDFSGLALRDLALARDLFHVQLANHPNVIGTALGRYLIRDSEAAAGTGEQRTLRREAKPARTLDNARPQPYSWPCVLVFVERWIQFDELEAAGPNADQLVVPRQLWLPDGRSVPVCVVEAAPVTDERPPLPPLEFPQGFVGAGFPMLSTAQGQTRVGTIGSVVTDGRKMFALASSHALPPPGEVVDTLMNGTRVPIGTCSSLSITRLPVGDAYPNISGSTSWLTIDVGLIELDDVHRWTTTAFGIGDIGPLADARSESYSLDMIGQRVIARGVAGGEMSGAVKALLYRYKSIGGREYLADFVIGSDTEGEVLPTQAGDSGAIWYLAPPVGRERQARTPPRPLALQWGGEVFQSSAGGRAPYALGASVATVLATLDLDLVRNWNDSLFRYWGAVGHYGIALRAIDLLPNGPLRTLMANNRDGITFPSTEITDANLSGLSKRFVPLADVPDLVWKIGKGQRGPRHHNPEGPNHFADMDQADSQGRTLLDICTNRDDAINPVVWRAYFDDPQIDVDEFHQGCLPFRVWQIFDKMVEYASTGKTSKFVSAAGVLAHYIGDACQPLHISAWHDGDPTQTETLTTNHRDGSVTTEEVALGSGVHAAYEDDMVNLHIGDIFTGLAAVAFDDAIDIPDGPEAAWQTIGLMRNTIGTIAPPDIVERYLEVRDLKPQPTAQQLWETFGEPTVQCMAAGAQLLASLWLHAWSVAGADAQGHELDQVSHATIHNIVVPKTFLPSHTLATIDQVL